MIVVHDPITDPIVPGTAFELTIVHQDSQRLDVYLASQFPRYSRSFLQQLIKQGFVRLNNVVTKKSGAPLQKTDSLIVTFPNNKPHREPQQAASEFNITIIHEEEHFLIINKPAGLLIHPPHASSSALSLIDWIVFYDQTIRNVGTIDRPGIVHRLDRDTSGLLIIPRTNYAHGIFGSLFRDHGIKKTYYAVVHGHPPRSGTINYALGRDPACPVKMKAFSPDNTQHRAATTHYTVQDYYDTVSFLQLKPISGRTHQIRVHCATLGHPLVGDAVYGKKSPFIGRHALHAAQLEFEFEGASYNFSLPLPDDMVQLLSSYTLCPAIDTQ